MLNQECIIEERVCLASVHSSKFRPVRLVQQLYVYGSTKDATVGIKRTIKALYCT